MPKVPSVRKRRAGYTQAAADLVCDAIATSPCGLRRMIAGDPTLPRERTIYLWLDLNPAFREAYERARQRQADLLMGECVEIADNSEKDVLERTTRDGQYELVANPTNVARSKLRIDTRLTVAARLAPRKYGKVIPLPPEELPEAFRPHNGKMPPPGGWKPFMYKSLDDLIC